MATWGGAYAGNGHEGGFGKDSFIMQSEPDTNYGDDDSLMVGVDLSGKTSILDWTLAQVDFSSLPAGAIVSSAYIYMYLHTGLISEDFKARWYRITEAWVEDEVTWNDQPGTTTSQLSEEITLGVFWNAWDVWTGGGADSLIADAIANRGKILDVICKGTVVEEGVWYAQFYSKDELAETSKWPYLIITYTVAGADHDAVWVQVF